MKITTIDNMYEDAGRDLLRNLLAVLDHAQRREFIVAILPEYRDVHGDEHMVLDKVYVCTLPQDSVDPGTLDADTIALSAAATAVVRSMHQRARAHVPPKLPTVKE